LNDARSHDEAAARVVEATARASYGRLVAFLAARWRDLTAAEDALAEAFAAALRTWPSQGVPAKPESWLLAVAHRRLVDLSRHDRVRADAAEELARLAGSAGEAALSDERLSLLFVCAHPAIAAEARAPLILQAVLGLDAVKIACAFLASPAAMGQRLSRAKTKIRDAGIAYRVPDADEFPERLDAVLDAIYAAYGASWEDAAAGEPRSQGLSAEAITLGRSLVELLPESAEARGLLALLLHCEARRAARRDKDGRYVPLARQSVERWDRRLIDEAEEHLARAAKIGASHPGRYQLEAAIQSVHAARARPGRVDWVTLRLFYDAVVARTPAIGARLGRIAAQAEVEGAEPALQALDRLAAEAAARLASHQPYWALRTHLLRRLGREAEAAAACRRAISLATDPAVRAFLAAGGSEHLTGGSG
jgi:RNA polymerase sigma-70 factor (ECF subfamily)